MEAVPLSLSAPALWESGMADLIHDTVGANIACILSPSRTHRIRRLTLLLRERIITACPVVSFVSAESAPYCLDATLSHTRTPRPAAA
jgi:hypothetical protein